MYLKIKAIFIKINDVDEELVSIKLQEHERLLQNIENRKKTAYTGIDEGGEKKGILSQYDEPHQEKKVLHT